VTHSFADVAGQADLHFVTAVIMSRVIRFNAWSYHKY
jgi:hypothetical protein